MREKLIELLDATFEKQYDRDLVITARNTADHLIANGVTIQRWIPVSEQPKESGRYLCRVQSCIFRGTYYTDVLRYDHGVFRHDGIHTDITHWMPLPEPPTDTK